MSKLLQISVYQSAQSLEKPYLAIGLVSPHNPLLYYISASLQYYSQYHLIGASVRRSSGRRSGGRQLAMT